MKGLLALCIVVAVALIGSALFVPFQASGSSTVSRAAHGAAIQTQSAAVSPSHLSSASPAVQNNAAKSGNPFVSAAMQDGVPLKYVYIPAAKTVPRFKNGVYQIGYAQSPAPMGIGAYGIRNVSGQLEAFSYTTSTFNASVNLTSLRPFLLANDAPSSVSIQLNAVTLNTTLFGVSAYDFWTQNVAFYSARQHYLELIDNIWNFSSPAVLMSSNAIYSHTAFRVPYPYAYIGIGPTIPNVSTPFNLSLQLQTAVIGGMDTVFFNYSVMYTNSSSGKLQAAHGVFDEVQFNSLNGLQGYAAPPTSYLVTGSYVTPTGFIPWDAEIMIGGPGGGSSTDIYSIGGTLSLMYMNSANAMANVPSAYDVGSETGETSTGIAVAWNANHQAILSAGPSLVYGMWGIEPFAGDTTYTGTVSPSNAFMFVSPGAPVSSSLGDNGWVPLAVSGQFNFTLPTGTYYQETMMSYYTPVSGALASGSITLSSNPSLGIYTPLYAWNNYQLANISIGGKGTLSSPYIADNYTHTYISPLFANINDYGFESFSGLLIANTTMYFDAMNMPPLLTTYQMPQAQLYADFYGIPLLDGMTFEIYGASHVSIYGARLISGSLASYYAAGFPDADMMVWNSTSVLIAGSVFYAENSISLLVYNPSTVKGNNTIWGNWFTTSSYAGGGGLYMSSSGNTVFNNYFGDAKGSNAYTPRSDPYTGLPVVYVDTWNVTKSPATTKFTVNGITLTGSIVNTPYVGGNYWDDYVPGSTLPFNESGNIEVGGDYVPLVITDGYYPVVFVAADMLPGTQWSVNVSGYMKTTTLPAIIYYGLNGTYSYTAMSSTGFITPSSGSVTVGGYGVVTDLYILPTYTLTVTETNLPPGFNWGVLAAPISPAFGQVFQISNASTITLELPIGYYLIEYGALGYYYTNIPEYLEYGYQAKEMPITSNVSLSVSVPPIYTQLIVEESGLATGAAWSADVWMVLNNTAIQIANMSSTSAVLYFPVVMGIYEIQFYAPGYMADPVSEMVGVYGTTYVSVAFIQLFSLTFTETGLPAGTTWTVDLYSSSGYAATASGSGSSITLMVPAGTYSYTLIASSSSYNTVSGTVAVAGNENVNAPFTLSQYATVTVTFTETGLSAGTQWWVTFNGQTQGSTGSSISFTTTPGTYYYQAYSNGSTSPQGSGYLNVKGSMSVSVQFMPQTYTVTFIEQGLPANASWSINFNGQPLTTNKQLIVLSVPAGSYSFSVGNVSGFKTSVSTSTINIGHNTIVVVQYQAVKKITPSSSLSTYGFDALFLVVGLVVGAVGVLLYARRKMGRKQ